MSFQRSFPFSFRISGHMFLSLSNEYKVLHVMFINLTFQSGIIMRARNDFYEMSCGRIFSLFLVAFGVVFLYLL